MPSAAEWRLFLPNENGCGRPPPYPEARTLLAIVDDVPPVARTDVYLKADANVGVKRRGGRGLEIKALKQRQTLGGGVGPGAADIFAKVKLDDDASPADVLEQLRKEAASGGGGGAGVSEELGALMTNPLEVRVEKSVRKVDVGVGEGTVSFEVTDVTVDFAEIPEGHPKNWITFCAEGTLESMERFLEGKGRPLVALFSLREALQAGYPRFVQIMSTA
ncbi:unnamed protein product [Pylaiella littoralis]